MATKAARTKARAKASGKKTTRKKADPAKSYNQYKAFEGKQYTGMKVGRSHKWNYDRGDWRETKITPDLWEINYAVTKRRAGKAPEGSGVPVGTEYHWYILAHQHVRKLNANDYSTVLYGFKYKLAHKRSDKQKWSAGASSQKKRLIKLMRELIARLEKEGIPLQIEHDGRKYRGEALPVEQACFNGGCSQLEIILNDHYMGIIKEKAGKWKMEGMEDQKLADTIGEAIESWYKM